MRAGAFRGLTIASVVGLIVALAAPAQAMAGDLDPAFNGTGLRVTSFGGDDHALGVAVQTNGRIVAAGFTEKATGTNFAVARYTSAGLLDTAFNGTGKRTTDFGSDSFGQAAAIQPDGKIVVAGYTQNGANSNFAVARYNPNGTLDGGFGSGGKKTFGFPSVSQSGAYDVAIDGSGRIVLAGFAVTDFAVARLTSTGILDNTFDGDGRQVVDFGPNDVAFGVAISPVDGKIVVAGDAVTSTLPIHARFGVAQLTTMGALDMSFSMDGKVRASFGSSSDAFAEAVAVQTNGKIVAVGQTSSATGADFALVRLKTDGTLDGACSGDGRQSTSFADNDDATGVALQADGKIVAGGGTFTGVEDDIALARYTTGCLLDGTFGAGGKVTTDVIADDRGADVALSPVDGKIALAGDTSDGSNYDFVVARYLD